MPIRNSLLLCSDRDRSLRLRGHDDCDREKDLKVTTQMSATIFLDIENEHARTVYIDIRIPPIRRSM